jgi:hypothetical protein
VLDNAGHLVFIEWFAEVNREVVSFFKKPDKRSTQRPPERVTEAPKTERGAARPVLGGLPLC